MCEYCMYYEYDQSVGEWSCVMDMSGMDQDELWAMTGQSDRPCPFYHAGDEYTVVRRQN